MRELTYFVASSVDGFIAHNDGGLDGFSMDESYISELFSEFPETLPSHLHEMFGITPTLTHFDTVLMGRKSYEAGLKEGVTSPYSHLEQYVFSSSMRSSPDKQINLVQEDAVGFVSKLKGKSGKGIWLCGGGKFASTLINHGLVDRLS